MSEKYCETATVGGEPCEVQCGSCSKPLTAPSEDAVGVALMALDKSVRHLVQVVGADETYLASATYVAARNAYATAVESRVRAECAAKVRGVKRFEMLHADGENNIWPRVNGSIVRYADVLAALEAQP